MLTENPGGYNFILNPYPTERISRCPLCEGKTGQKKIPLLIHVDPARLIALNYTCRYCGPCHLLIGHTHEIEHHMTEAFRHSTPELIGNRYLVMGTVEKKYWREGLTEFKTPTEMIDHTTTFTDSYEDIRLHRPGWYKDGQEQPVMEPPPSCEWVKVESELENE